MKKVFLLALLMAVVMVGTVNAEWDPAAKDFKGFDLGGATVHYKAPFPQDKVERIEKAEKLFNCKIEYHDELNLEERLLSGESVHDIYDFMAPDAWKYIAKGALLPVTEYIPDYYKKYGGKDNGTVSLFSYRGEGYALYHDTFTGVNATARFMLWNKELFNRLGLEDPNKLYENGDWTWEKVREIALKVTEDLDGDGEIDQWGLYSLYPWLDLMISNEANFIEKDEKGLVRYASADPEALEVFETAYQWINVDKILKVAWSDAPWKEGKVALFPRDAWAYGGYLNDLDFEWGVLPMPKGPSADDYHVAQNGVGAYFLPANAEDIEELVALHDFLYAPENFALEQQYSIRNHLNEWAPDRYSAKVMEEGFKNWDGKSIKAWLNIFPDSYWEAYDAAMAGEKKPAEALKAVEDEVQSVIDDLFNQN